MTMTADPRGRPATVFATSPDLFHALSRRATPRRALAALTILGLAIFFSFAFTPAISANPATLLARLTSHAFTAASILIAVMVADVVVDRGAQRFPAYALAVIGGAVVGALLGWPLREALGMRFAFQGRASAAQMADFALYHRLDQLLLGILVGGLATFVHVNRRTALAARRRQHDAERARSLAQRRTLESQLQALQARIEPMFLFETLKRIRTLYRADVDAAGHMLEDLIVYLRAALPHLRESTSTAGQEMMLVRSWLDIVIRSAGQWRIECSVEEAAREARMPALVLLPLVQFALSEPGTAARTLDLSVQADAGRLLIRVVSSSSVFASATSCRELLDQIGERLHALYGGDARFDCRHLAQDVPGSEACIALPLESRNHEDTAEGP